MLNEIKILFNNIKNFRQLLTEGVGEKDIIDAIQNHEWLYIYYTGDKKTKSGARTIRPYVLGVHNMSGNVVLRAWQDNPKNSWHFDNRPTRPKSNPNMEASKYHDYWVDGEGEKPGWRMFRLDKILKLYPIGKIFHDSNDRVMIPAGYHEGGDDNMSSIIAYVSTKTQPDYEKEKEFQGDKLSRTDKINQNWDSIRRGDKNKKEITARDIIKLRDIASNVYKKSHNSYLVVIDDRNNYQLMLASDKDKKNIPDSAIVGNLSHLYSTMVKKNAPVDKKFFNAEKNKTHAALKNKQQSTIKETELPTIPFEKKTFFK